MGGLHSGKSGTARRWLTLGVLLLIPLGLLLVWVSSAPALTVPELDRDAQATFSAGTDFVLAIKTDGSLWAWGENEGAQLGDGTTTDRKTPTKISSSLGWATVAAGHDHSLGIKIDGSLWAWGLNDHGQLGDGTTTGRKKPVAIAAGTKWVAVSAGFRYSLGIKTDGSLWAWGINDKGQLGNGTDTERHVPTRVLSSYEWVAVSAGDSHCLGITSQGFLWAWGSNMSGMVGDGTTSNRDKPKRVGDPDYLWAAVSAGSWHSMALRTDGTLWTWGNDSQGQLGNGTAGSQTTPKQVGTSSNWVALAADGRHSLALGKGGTLWAWGENNVGEVGDGTTVDRKSPVQVGTATKWMAVSAGWRFSLGLRDGDLCSWGLNDVGQLGLGSTTNKSIPTNCLGNVKPPTTTTSSSSSSSGSGGSTGSSEASTDSSDTTDTTGTGGSTDSSDTTDTTGATTTFSDVPDDHPYHDAIYYLADAGVVAGREDGTFGPDAPVTRQQFAKMIVKTLGYPVTGTEVCPFTDVATQIGTDPFYPSKYVAVCASHGITTGKTPTTFAPGDNITHQQLITMVARAAGLSAPPADYVPSFTAAQFSLDEHYQNARKAAYAGLLDGLQGLGPTYDFLAPSTRGECAQLLYNLSQR